MDISATNVFCKVFPFLENWSFLMSCSHISILGYMVKERLVKKRLVSNVVVKRFNPHLLLNARVGFCLVNQQDQQVVFSATTALYQQYSMINVTVTVTTKSTVHVLIKLIKIILKRALHKIDWSNPENKVLN